MEIKKTVERYLNINLDVAISLKPLPSTTLASLPLFLRELYDFYEADILNTPCIFMVSKPHENLLPAVIKKHIDKLKTRFGYCIYVQEIISSFNRNRLITQRIPFIIPGKQMFLPFLGIDLREHFHSNHLKKNRFLSSATQVAVIWALLDKSNTIFTPKMLAKETNYSLMTMLRAFKELKSAGIEGFYQKGREHFWKVSDRKTLWEQTKLLLNTPIQKTVWTEILPTFMENGVQAGLTALSNYTLLTPPETEVYAISRIEWRKLKLKHETQPVTEIGFVELQIWNYDPKFEDKSRFSADPFSVYLSLKDNPDERVQSALEEMMEKLKW